MGDNLIEMIINFVGLVKLVPKVCSGRLGWCIDKKGGLKKLRYSGRRFRLEAFPNGYSPPLTNLAAQTEFSQPQKDCSGSSKDAHGL